MRMSIPATHTALVAVGLFAAVVQAHADTLSLHMLELADAQAGICVTPRHVYLFEAWGLQAPFAAAMPALETSAKSIKVSWMADVLF